MNGSDIVFNLKIAHLSQKIAHFSIVDLKSWDGGIKLQCSRMQTCFKIHCTAHKSHYTTDRLSYLEC